MNQAKFFLIFIQDSGRKKGELFQEKFTACCPMTGTGPSSFRWPFLSHTVPSQSALPFLPSFQTAPVHPLPESAQNHQVKNAYSYAQNGACQILEEPNFTPNFFLERLKYLFSHPQELEKMKCLSPCYPLWKNSTRIILTVKEKSWPNYSLAKRRPQWMKQFFQISQSIAKNVKSLWLSR